jgi:hypothetical protein
MNAPLALPTHLAEIKEIVTALRSTECLINYMSPDEYLSVTAMDVRFAHYTQQDLEEDLARYIPLARYYRNVKRLVIWRLRKGGFMYRQIGEMFGITKARVAAICDREERIERRASK